MKEKVSLYNKSYYNLDFLFCLFFKTGFLCIALVVLELTL